MTMKECSSCWSFVSLFAPLQYRKNFCSFNYYYMDLLSEKYIINQINKYTSWNIFKRMCFKLLSTSLYRYFYLCYGMNAYITLLSKLVGVWYAYDPIRQGFYKYVCESEQCLFFSKLFVLVRKKSNHSKNIGAAQAWYETIFNEPGLLYFARYVVVYTGVDCFEIIWFFSVKYIQPAIFTNIFTEPLQIGRKDPINFRKKCALLSVLVL